MMSAAMKQTEWHERDPFTDQYVRDEVAFYGLREYSKDGVTVTTVRPMGVLHDYLNKNFATGELHVPALKIDGQLWMSLTRMECQSQHLPIQFASGRVGTVGLGLGHFALRVMAKPEVDSLTVFEQDPRIITYFKECFSGRSGYDKVTFVEGDARQTCQGHEFDFLYVDCYQTSLGDEVVEDIERFTTGNDLCGGVDSYHFWGMERVFLEACLNGHSEMSEMPYPIYEYVSRWYAAHMEGDGVAHVPLHSMYQSRLEYAFIEKVMSGYGLSCEDEDACDH